MLRRLKQATDPELEGLAARDLAVRGLPCGLSQAEAGRPQHRLYLMPLPQKHGSFRPGMGSLREGSLGCAGRSVVALRVPRVAGVAHGLGPVGRPVIMRPMWSEPPPTPIAPLPSALISMPTWLSEMSAENAVKVALP